MKNSKNVYKLLNNMNINLENYDKEVLSDMEKQSLKNSFRKRGKRLKPIINGIILRKNL